MLKLYLKQGFQSRKAKFFTMKSHSWEFQVKIEFEFLNSALNFPQVSKSSSFNRWGVYMSEDGTITPGF